MKTLPEFKRGNDRKWACPDCSRVGFTTESSLRMHWIRMHSGKGWSTGQNFQTRKPTTTPISGAVYMKAENKPKGMTEEQRLELNRAYQREWNRKRRQALAAAKAPVLVQTQPVAPAPAPAVAAAAAAAVAPQMTKADVIAKIAREYLVDNRIEISTAFAQHPEWLSVMGYKSASYRDIKPMYTLVRSYRAKEGLIPTKKKGLRTPVETNSAPAAAAALPEPIAFCPHCGFQLRMFQTAYSIAAKHSTR